MATSSNYSVTITSRDDNFATAVFDKVVTREELQDTIVKALIDINAEYPLTYGDEITALIDHNNGEMGYRVDTIGERKEVDSHFIYVAAVDFMTTDESYDRGFDF